MRLRRNHPGICNACIPDTDPHEHPRLSPTPSLAHRNNNTHRWIRQIHLWIGAWGALAAVLYGFTGLVMNHRFNDNKSPQGEAEDGSKLALVIPASARATPEALSLWLRETRQLDAQVIRKPPPGDTKQPARWTLTGGSATQAWTVEYTAGSDSAEYKATRHSPLAALNRLHKAYGGGVGWVILADSFAICMLLLGLSGLWMWSRGRTMRQVVFSVLAASVAVTAVIVVPALL